MSPQPAKTSRARRNGFSLVELMVVLFVMGLLASVVVLAIPGDSRELRTEAERFAARASAARDEAITASAPVSMVVSDTGYYFEQRVAGNWQPFPGDRFGLTAWNEGTHAVTGEEARARAGRSRIVFDTVGLASSDAAVRLSRKDQTMTVRIARDGMVSLDGH
ncbi:MAG: GspH/FimT family pseudopilin [Sphingomonadales bacterium]|nr:GspH/FimT family pseudopilin [Sphingomonadales bacterium]MDE2569329.1 GspH/FimT family pseudopilin [Sphingomonadales bacterium]